MKNKIYDIISVISFFDWYLLALRYIVQYPTVLYSPNFSLIFPKGFYCVIVPLEGRLTMIGLDQNIVSDQIFQGPIFFENLFEI